jgi:hypothetical protein
MTVEHNHPSNHEFSSAEWQALGEIELPIGSDTSVRGNAWLAETLKPLELRADFSNKVMKSAQETIARAVHPSRALVAFEHIHITVFVPTDSASKGQNWGFFRIEKFEGAPPDDSFPAHAIEFFLYREEG